MSNNDHQKTDTLVASHNSMFDYDESSYDLSAEENIIVLVDLVLDPYKAGNKKATVTEMFIIPREDGIGGAASYQSNTAGDFVMQHICEEIMDLPEEPGIYVLEKVSGAFQKGDGWMTDDNLDIWCDHTRPASPEEISIMNDYLGLEEKMEPTTAPS